MSAGPAGLYPCKRAPRPEIPFTHSSPRPRSPDSTPAVTYWCRRRNEVSSTERHRTTSVETADVRFRQLGIAGPGRFVSCRVRAGDVHGPTRGSRVANTSAARAISGHRALSVSARFNPSSSIRMIQFNVNAETGLSRTPPPFVTRGEDRERRSRSDLLSGTTLRLPQPRPLDDELAAGREGLAGPVARGVPVVDDVEERERPELPRTSPPFSRRNVPATDNLRARKRRMPRPIVQSGGSD